MRRADLRLCFLVSDMPCTQLAYDAFQAAVVSTLRQSASEVEQDAATIPVTEFIRRHAQMAKLVQRTTKLAAFDLLRRGPHASLCDTLIQDGISRLATAAVLEIQLVTLNQSLDRLEAHGVIPCLLKDLLQIYSPQTCPMRRARWVLVG